MNARFCMIHISLTHQYIVGFGHWDLSNLLL
jgi:hypothetical protein